MTNILKTKREALGWSRAELARRAEMNASSIGQIENGRMRPYPVQVEKIAKALGLSDADKKKLANNG